MPSPHEGYQLTAELERRPSVRSPIRVGQRQKVSDRHRIIFDDNKGGGRMEGVCDRNLQQVDPNYRLFFPDQIYRDPILRKRVFIHLEKFFEKFCKAIA